MALEKSSSFLQRVMNMQIEADVNTALGCNVLLDAALVAILLTFIRQDTRPLILCYLFGWACTSSYWRHSQ